MQSIIFLWYERSWACPSFLLLFLSHPPFSLSTINKSNSILHFFSSRGWSLNQEANILLGETRDYFTLTNVIFLTKLFLVMLWGDQSIFSVSPFAKNSLWKKQRDGKRVVNQSFEKMTNKARPHDKKWGLGRIGRCKEKMIRHFIMSLKKKTYLHVMKHQ